MKLKKRMAVTSDGREAFTAFNVLEYFADHALLEVLPKLRQFFRFADPDPFADPIAEQPFALSDGGSVRKVPSGRGSLRLSI